MCEGNGQLQKALEQENDLLFFLPDSLGEVSASVGTPLRSSFKAGS